MKGLFIGKTEDGDRLELGPEDLQTHVHGVGASRTGKSKLRNEGIASIYGLPFLYFQSFWSDEAQSAIRADIKYSDRMDAVIMSGYTLFQEWNPMLISRINAHKNIQVLLPNPDSELFRLIQKSWGLDDPQLDARKERVRIARKNLEDLFQRETPNLKADEKKNVQWKIHYYDQCPFYSFYLFDDKAYLAQYPFLRPGKLASPVYVFFRSSSEYERLDREWKGLQASIRQTSVDK